MTPRKEKEPNKKVQARALTHIFSRAPLLMKNPVCLVFAFSTMKYSFYIHTDHRLNAEQDVSYLGTCELMPIKSFHLI
jgi:hypothetical protein